MPAKNLRRLGIDALQAVEQFVHFLEFTTLEGRAAPPVSPVFKDDFQPAATLPCAKLATVIDEEMAHLASGHCVEMNAVLPVDFFPGEIGRASCRERVLRLV